MNILNFVSEIFSPLEKLIDSVHTSTQEKIEAKAKLEVVRNEITTKVLDYQTQLLKSQADLIGKESKGESWLQRNWRPVTMLTFLLLVVLDSFGLLAYRLAQESWLLLQIGLGGYVVGRSVEKTVKVGASIYDKTKQS